MKAQQSDSVTTQLQLRVIGIPVPSENEILVKVSGSSIPGSDRLLFDPEFFSTKDLQHPVTMGYEATGIVSKVGKNIVDFSVGDPVGFFALSGCFECVHRKTSCGCPSILMDQGFNYNGYLQEYVVVDSRSATKLPPGVDIATSVPFRYAGMTAYNAIKECGPESGKWLAIFGAGVIEKMAIQYAKAMGFMVVVVENDHAQLDDAKRVGADYTLKPSDLSPDHVVAFIKRTGGGVDAAVSFTTSSQSYSIMQGLIKFNGILLVAGITDELRVGPIDVRFKSLFIKGASNVTTRDLKECLEFSAKHDIKAPHKFIRTSDVPHAIEEMKSGVVRECMIVLL